ncbi:MAG TPA: glycerate kinase, partial [Chthoniobacterales bacterium]
IAPDKFKGTLSAREVAEAIANGLRDVLPDAKIDIVPLADGGEGTAEVITNALRGSWMNCKARDPLGREINARYGWIEKLKLAVMEMSEAAGMRRLKPNELNPEIATTFGVGEMILDATRRGAKEIIIGLGGSATNDGGSGMARALGFHFSTAAGSRFDGFKPSSLQKLERIEKPANLKLPKIIAAVDVKNPLLGENGATRVFGPQKGVTPDKIDKFEHALSKLADVVAAQFGFDYRNEPGAGAAGGLGFGLLSFCGAKIRPGFDVVAEAVGLESKMKGVDLVITGEGSLDRQTLEGKTPAGVAKLARKFGKRVFAFVGRASDDPEPKKLFDGAYTNARSGMSDEENMKRAAEILRDNARQLAEDLKKTFNAQRPTPQ